jgi:hypothetical protein
MGCSYEPQTLYKYPCVDTQWATQNRQPPYRIADILVVIYTITSMFQF